MINRLDQFVKPRTGDVDLLSDNERQQVADSFSGLVDDMLLVHAQHIDTTNYTRFANTSSLMLTYPLENDRRLHIVVHSRQTAVNSMDSEKSVFVRETDQNNRSYRWHSYDLKPGSPDVIRSDFYATPQELMQPLEDEWDEDNFDSDYYDELNMTPDELREQEEELTQLLRESPYIQDILVNAQFEEQVGLNYLPVDADEVAKLRELLSHAEFIHN